MLTLLSNNTIHSSDTARVKNGDLWMNIPEYRQLLGDMPKGSPQDGDVNVSAQWQALQRPIISDESNRVWALGASAAERAGALQSLHAPDFTLPDLDGNVHALSDFRGKKVFLVSWASW